MKYEIRIPIKRPGFHGTYPFFFRGSTRQHYLVDSEDMSYPNMGVDTSSGTTSVDHIYKLQWRIPMYLGFCEQFR